MFYRLRVLRLAAGVLTLSVLALTPACGQTANVTFPKNGATNVDPYLTLAWTMVSAAQSYSFVVGTVPQGSDVYVSPSLTVTSSFVPGLKSNTSYYVTLFTTTTSSATTSSSSSFTTGTGIAHLTAPLNGATEVDPFAPFCWTPISDATAYYLKLGTQPTVMDTMNNGSLSPTITSMIPQGLLGGTTYYAILSTQKAGHWSSVTTSFTTAAQPLPTNINTYHATIQGLISQVRNMTVGVTNTPLAGTLLAQFVAADHRTHAFCTEFAETLEQLLLQNRISARIRHSVFDGTSTESHTFNEYYDLYSNQWVLVDSDFGAFYSGLTLEELSALVAARNWTAVGSDIIYATQYGKQVFTNYYMDPILLFLSPIPNAGKLQLPLANSPAPFFQVHSASDIGIASLFVFGFATASDKLTISDPSKGTITLTPQNGTSYSSALTLHQGWTITSAPAGLQILTIPRAMF